MSKTPSSPSLLWLNGRLVSAAEAHIDPADRGWTLGDGLFETFYCPGGQPAHVRAHLARLAAGAEILDVPLPLSGEAIAHALTTTLDAHGTGDAVARLTLTRGAGPRGLVPPRVPQPTLMITVAPAAASAGGAISVVIATVTRRNEFSPLARVKSLNYLDGVLARIEAEHRGADDAILLNTQGAVVETTISNLFAVIDGRLVTPPVADGALPGIHRHLVLERAGAVEASLAVTDLMRAKEVLLCNCLGLRAVVCIDGRRVGTGAPGPTFTRIAALALHKPSPADIGIVPAGIPRPPTDQP